MRYYRTTGLEITQMRELVLRVQGELAEPWRKGTGRPKSCGLYEAAEIACMYIRQNATEEFLGDVRHVSQSTVSRIVTVLVPIVKLVLEEFVPSAADAIEMVRGRVCLVDGTITPCWSYEDHRELWSRKHGTTGFNAQLICVLSGNPVYISGPLPGKTHDAAAFRETPAAEIVKNSGGGIGDKGCWSQPVEAIELRLSSGLSARRSSASTSAGVLNPRIARGRSFISSATI